MKKHIATTPQTKPQTAGFQSPVLDKITAAKKNNEVTLDINEGNTITINLEKQNVSVTIDKEIKNFSLEQMDFFNDTSELMFTEKKSYYICCSSKKTTSIMLEKLETYYSIKALQANIYQDADFISLLDMYKKLQDGNDQVTKETFKENIEELKKKISNGNSVDKNSVLLEIYEMVLEGLEGLEDN